MTDDELRKSYGALREYRRASRTESETSPRPEPEAIWSALAGELEPGERVRILDEALRAGAGEEVALAYSLQSAAVAVTSIKTRRTPLSVHRWWPIAAAAALVAMVGVTQLRSSDGTGETSTGDAVRYRDANLGAPVLLAPAEDTPLVADAMFIWHPIPDARDYALEAIDAEGRIVARVITADSTAVLPSSLSADERQSISGWWVLATTRDGAQRRSDLRLVVADKRP